MRQKRQHIAFKQRLAAVDRLAGHIDHRTGIVVFPSCAAHRKVEAVRLRERQRRRAHLFEHRAKCAVLCHGIERSLDGLAVHREVVKKPARLRSGAQINGLSRRHRPDLGYRDRAVLHRSEGNGADLLRAAAFKPQHRIAAVFLRGVRGKHRTVGVEQAHKALALHLRCGKRLAGDTDFPACALIVAVCTRIVVAAGEIVAVAHGVTAGIVAADAAAIGRAVRVDRADIIAVVDVHTLVRAEDAARGTGVGRRNRTGVVAISDDSIAPRAADDAADALGIGVADRRAVGAVLDHHAVARLADAPDHAADHASAVNRAG